MVTFRGDNIDAPMPDLFPARLRGPSFGPAKAEATAARMLTVIPREFRGCAVLAEAEPRLSFPASDVIAVAARIFAGTVRRVTIHGVAGDGKTTAAALMVGELSRLVAAHYAGNERDPLGHTLSFWDFALAWCSAHELATDADEQQPGEGATELARRMRSSPIAVVDDIGNEKGRFPGSNMVPAGILQTRFDAALVTVTTTGLASTELQKNYGVGVKRRLSDAKDPLSAFIPAKSRKTGAK